MPRGIKIAHSGVNALTDTDPSHFSLYIDGTTDHILVKEVNRTESTINATTTLSVNHNLGYFPYFVAEVEILGGEFQWIYGSSTFSPYKIWVTTTQFKIVNGESSAKDFSYYLFYDQI
jgi:hypothetical protein